MVPKILKMGFQEQQGTTTTHTMAHLMPEWKVRHARNAYYVQNAIDAKERMQTLRGRLQREALWSSVRIVEGYSDLCFRIQSPYGEMLFTDPADEHFGLETGCKKKPILPGALARIQSSWNRSGGYYQQVVVYDMKALHGVILDHLHRGKERT